MLAPSIISGCKPVTKCEGPNRVIGRAPHSASEEEVLPTIPLAPFNPKQAAKAGKEYPVWQAVLRNDRGLTP